MVDGDPFNVWPEETPAQPGQGAPQVVRAAIQEAQPPRSGAAPRDEAGGTVTQPAIMALPSIREASGSTVVTAPMPGLIIEVSAKAGDNVAPGDLLVVLEAMKMKNPIRAMRAAKVCAVLVAQGDHVKKSQPLVEYAG